MISENNHEFDGNRLRFILSTGRTGTTQLREYLKKYFQDQTIWFEPPPSRELYLLWNAEQSGLLPKHISLNLLKKIKSSRLKKVTSETIVEFDSYLSPLICEFLPYVQSPCVVHLVRHPYSWIQSMGNFKAASWRKYAVDIIPFTYLVHPEARHGWRRLDKIQKLAWSWRLVNESILKQKSFCSAYELFKFENFISPDPVVRKNTIDGILTLINCKNVNRTSDIDINLKINKSVNEDVAAWQNWPVETRERVDEICNNLMSVFNYEVNE